MIFAQIETFAGIKIDDTCYCKCFVNPQCHENTGSDEEVENPVSKFLCDSCGMFVDDCECAYDYWWI